MAHGHEATKEEIHELYSAINFFDDEWTDEATAVLNKIIAVRVDPLLNAATACPQGHAGHSCCDCPTRAEVAWSEKYRAEHDRVTDLEAELAACMSRHPAGKKGLW